MRRFGSSYSSHLGISCKMPLCLRFGGVAVGNGGSSVCDKCTNCPDSRNGQIRPSDSYRKEGCECHRNKNNIFNALRRKWRSRRRDRCETRKRSEGQLNVCHARDEEVHVTCPKHRLLKNWRSGSKSSSSTLTADPLHDKSQDHCNDKENTVIHESNEECSCFGSPSKAFSSVTAKVVKLKARSSRSLSDISYAANVSSQTMKTDSESDICNVSSLSNQNSPNNVRFSEDSTLCVDASENVGTSAEEDVIPSFGSQPGQKIGSLTQELFKLSKYGWYWGPINRSEAESKLVDQPDGAFLVRDSCDDRYILSLSFRCYGKTLHTRIEHSNGLFSFYSQPEPEGHTSIVELIKQSMCYSQSGVFCYSRSRSPGSPSFPVRLTKPISRFTQVRSLQYLCRFVIRQYTRFDHIQKLPLPDRIKGYLEEGHY